MSIQVFTAKQIIEDLGENPNVITYKVDSGATFWNPASTNRPTIKARHVRYIRYNDGGIDLQIIADATDT